MNKQNEEDEYEDIEEITIPETFHSKIIFLEKEKVLLKGEVFVSQVEPSIIYYKIEIKKSQESETENKKLEQEFKDIYLFNLIIDNEKYENYEWIEDSKNEILLLSYEKYKKLKEVLKPVYKWIDLIKVLLNIDNMQEEEEEENMENEEEEEIVEEINKINDEENEIIFKNNILTSVENKINQNKIEFTTFKVVENSIINKIKKKIEYVKEVYNQIYYTKLKPINHEKRDKIVPLIKYFSLQDSKNPCKNVLNLFTIMFQINYYNFKQFDLDDLLDFFGIEYDENETLNLTTTKKKKNFIITNIFEKKENILKSLFQYLFQCYDLNQDGVIDKEELEIFISDLTFQTVNPHSVMEIMDSYKKVKEFDKLNFFKVIVSITGNSFSYNENDENNCFIS
jgi:hypothetical protein